MPDWMSLAFLIPSGMFDKQFVLQTPGTPAVIKKTFHSLISCYNSLNYYSLGYSIGDPCVF